MDCVRHRWVWGEGQSCPWESGLSLILHSNLVLHPSSSLIDLPPPPQILNIFKAQLRSQLLQPSLAAQAFTTSFSKLDTKIGLVVITLCVVDPKKLQIYEKQA